MTETRGDLPRFDGVAAWSALSAEDQGAIGAAALELISFWFLTDESNDGLRAADPRLERICERDDGEFMSVLFAAVVTSVPREAFEAADGLPRIPSSLGDICRGCGCTYDDPCGGGCGWAEPGLCTACAPKPEDRT